MHVFIYKIASAGQYVTYNCSYLALYLTSKRLAFLE